MNSDIRLPVTFRDHPKKERLKRALKLRLGPADILTNFWITVSQNRPEGVLTGWDDTDIAIAAKWDRDPSELVKALIDCKLLDVLEDGTYKVHDWEEHQVWACGARARKEAAQKAAKAKWEKYARSKNMQTQSGGNASAEQGQESAYAQSLSSPNLSSPNHLEDRSPSVPSFKNSFNEEMGAFFESIIQSCEQIHKLPPKEKPFNSYQWVQQKVNTKHHPGAIDETLKALVKYWETTKEPWSYANTCIKTKNQKREAIEAHEKIKSGNVPEEIKGILSGIFRRI